MPRGASFIPDLRLSRLNKLVTRFMTPPNLLLTNMFGSYNEVSDQIEWESQTGNRGMTPFVAPMAEMPQTAPLGVAKHSAAAAYWKEKIPYGETFLNNLRKEGTESDYLKAQKRLAKDLKMLVNRCDRRLEWMFAKALVDGTFSYLQEGGIKLTVDYGILSANQSTLGTDYKWEAGSLRNPLQDIMDTKITVQRNSGYVPDTALFNSKVLQFLGQDPGLQTLLSKSHFGEGDLFKKIGGILNINTRVLGSLLGIDNMIVYDEQYVVTAWLTAAVTADSTTTIYVDDVTDFEVGGTLRFHDISAGTYEDETIASISVEAGTVTVSTAPSTSYKALEDKVTMTRTYLPDDKFILFTKSIEGQTVMEMAYAPFGLERTWGRKAHRWTTNDPDVAWIAVENKGLPVMYFNDAIYILTVN